MTELLYKAVTYEPLMNLNLCDVTRGSGSGCEVMELQWYTWYVARVRRLQLTDIAYCSASAGVIHLRHITPELILCNIL